tara:strand:+ start:466 stop:669 length:204 start_codon:yes stop_codon:yes gene_type:complete
MIENGDSISHWNFGAGVVKNSDPEKHQVPVEWEHDYTSVILVQFYMKQKWGVEEWVLREDCDLVSQR